MQRPGLAKWLVVGALAAFGMLGFAGQASAQDPEPTAEPAVQGSNASSESQATSADVTASSSATVNAGPSANGGSGQSSQIGNNNVTVNQKTSAKSGDAVAGSQVTGVVGGNATVQNQNSSSGAVATSGDVTVVNSATVNAGPSASGSQASQIGDNSVRVNQETVVESGSAVAGSQVTGIVGGSGDAVVQGQNSSTGADALSGDVTAVVVAAVNVGPSASGDDAQAQQFGSNDAVITQRTVVASGDAVAGSQVTGYVGSGGATVQNQNSSDGAIATSGDVVAVVVAATNVGPSASGAGAQAQQIGDNSAVVEQDTEVTSGDAVAGSQVTGLVSSERGHLTVQNQQSSDDAFATSGVAVATVVNTVNVGPSASATGDGDAMASQFGDNVADVHQHTVVSSGDAVAGSQVTGGVGGGDVTVQAQNASDGAEAESGVTVATVVSSVNVGPSAAAADGDAMAAQLGDNDAVVTQWTEVSSGDAVAGSQVVGWVGGDDVTIQLQNSSEGSVATSGVTVAVVVASVNIGPSADAGAGDTAMASQIGDNSADITQGSIIGSGDAVAGSQVVGVVGAGDSTIQHQNTSSGDVAFSGVVAGVSVLTGGMGPAADGDEALATQNGDNWSVIDQWLEIASGDSVAGSTVVGEVLL